MTTEKGLEEVTPNTPWLVWLSRVSDGLRMNQRVADLIPSQGTCWFAGQVPSRGCTRGNHTLMFLSLSFSLPSPPLSKSK